jgi:hypothetical protein
MTKNTGVLAAAAAAQKLQPTTEAQLSLIPEGNQIDRRAREEETEFEPPSRFEPGSDDHSEMLGKAKRGRGRPPGARNISSVRRATLITRMCGDPFLESARWAMHTPETLAKELACSKLEAFRELEAIRRDLRTFLYSRRAPTDGDGQTVAPIFALQIGGQVQPGGAEAPPPWEYPGGPELPKLMQNQEVNGNGADLSHDQVSHGEAK